MGVGDLLQFVTVLMVFVLADLVVLFEALQKIHAVAAHIADRDAGGFGVFRGKLGKFLTPFLIKFG